MRAIILALLLCGNALAAGRLSPPVVWQGSKPGSAEGNPGRDFALMGIWPDQVDQWRNYQPLKWNGSGWAAGEHKHGDAPSAIVNQDSIQIISEGSWGGNPGQKIASLVFTAPQTGIYEMTGRVSMKRVSGDAVNSLALLVFRGEEKAQEARRLRFRRRNPEPTELNTAVFLAQGDRLALVPLLGDNNKVEITIAALAIAVTPAAAAPADFLDGVRPAAPPPPAKDDKTPAIEIKGEQIDFPADANIVNVKQPPYGAKGDGITDDTAALNRALAHGGIIYLPNGVYLVSDQLRYSRGARVPSRTTLQGQSTSGTIIKLRDRTPDFSDPATAFAVVWTSHFPPQAFQIHVKNLTVHTGIDNPGAIGIQFYANNQGSIEDTRIVSGDGRGMIGLDLGFDSDQGPMLARNIRVEGFDTGIRCGRQTTVTTLENISVEGQKRVGFLNDMHCVALRHFTSKNACPAYIARDAAAYTAMIDSHIQGLPGGEAPAAIINDGGMYLRNVKVDGYPVAVNNQAQGQEGQVKQLPAEWTSHPVRTLWPDTRMQSLNLPIQEVPELPWGPLDTWVSVQSFKPEIIDTGKTYRGKKVTYEDWTQAIRQAMAAGKTTVYFPRNNYIVNGEIVVPPTVRRIIGLGSSFDRDRGEAVFIIGEGDKPVHFDRWDWNYSNATVLHQGKRTVCITNMLGGRYRAQPGAGDVFFTDNCQSGVEFHKGQRVWMRQFNPEYGDKPKIINNGADLWILGIKTEGYSTMIVTRNNGRTEIIGGMAYANQGHDPEALFINLAPSAFSCSLGEWVLRSQRFEDIVVEQKDGEVRALRYNQVPTRGDIPNGKPLGGYGTSFNLPLFVGKNDADRP